MDVSNLSSVNLQYRCERRDCPIRDVSLPRQRQVSRSSCNITESDRNERENPSSSTLQSNLSLYEFQIFGPS